VEFPLHLKLPNGKISLTNGFTSLGYCGIIVLNPLSCLSSIRISKEKRHTFLEEEIESLIQVIVGQLLTFLDLSLTAPQDTNMHISIVFASETSFSKWEFDAPLHCCVVVDVDSWSFTLAFYSLICRIEVIR
jgi:hypothetical protein